MRQHHLVLPMTLLLLLGCAAGPRPAEQVTAQQPQNQPQSQPQTQRQSMKGFALFSWKDDGNGTYAYALLEATNALPDMSRIRAQAGDLATVLQQLKTLKSGESVFWNFQVSSISSLHFMLPPAATLEQIRSTASHQGLQLEIDPFYAGQTSPATAQP